MASVISRTKGCQFRLKYEIVEYNDEPQLVNLMYAPYLLSTPIIGNIYIRTRNTNAIYKLIRLNEKHQPFPLEDTSKNVIYKDCYIERTAHIKFFEDPNDVDNKLGIRIAFSTVVPMSNK